MPHNIVVFTPGSSGSSVLSGLLGNSGFWLGDSTKKIDFDTHENARLVNLNVQILRASGYPHTFCNDLPPPSVKSIRDAVNWLRPEPFAAFAEECSRHGPWVWKDPRLCFTIHFWAKYMDFSRTKFLFINRRPDQSYAGMILKRRIPMSFAELCRMNDNYERSIDCFLEESGFECPKLTFEELLITPERALDKLNAHFGMQCTREDLARVYNGPLGVPRFTPLRCLRARLRYLVHRYVTRDHVRFPRTDLDPHRHGIDPNGPPTDENRTPPTPQEEPERPLPSRTA